MRTPHTCCKRGRVVRVTLRSGETFEDRFHERKAKFCVFRDRGRVTAGEIVKFVMLK